MIILPSIFGIKVKKETGAILEIQSRMNSYYHHIIERDPERERIWIALIIVYIIITGFLAWITVY